MKIGYCRVSTEDQVFYRQIDMLNNYGVDLIIKEKVSRDKISIYDRKGIKEILSKYGEGDIIVVPSLIRMSGSVKETISISDKFNEMGIQLVILNMQIDTATPIGKFFFHIMSAFSQFQVELIRESTKAGLDAARKRGRVGGRPKGLNEKSQKNLDIVKALLPISELSVTEICDRIGISRGTFYKYKSIIEKENEEKKEKEKD